VRKVTQLAKKERDAPKNKTAFTNPFSPYDPLMYVANVPPTHVCLLNKFNVVDQHLLAVTAAFEHQAVRLNAADFAAWWACIGAVGEGLGFYNCGPESGASQPHKHMQIIPGRSDMVDALIADAPRDWSTPRRSSRLPIQHAFVRFGDAVTPGMHRIARTYRAAPAVESTATAGHRNPPPSPPCAQRNWSRPTCCVRRHYRYRSLKVSTRPWWLRHACMRAAWHGNALPKWWVWWLMIKALHGRQDARQYPAGFASYNALLTAEMLLLAPRRAERTPADEDGVCVAVNALGLAGHILAKTDGELALIQRLGPVAILQMLAVPV
jgi:ATP adenylyltransferase/5',5'''-P-1,P-4-tetraphosphate phosphorylase II